jgi:GNAT superfamily N-acetyltransferase
MESIRLAELQDAHAISHVHIQSWRTTYAGLVPAEYLASLNEEARGLVWQDLLTRDTTYIAEIEGKVVGFAHGGPLRESVGDYDAELYSTYLLKEVQGRGLGRKLLGAVSGALKEKNFRSMLVWVLEQNPALGFYERMGAQRLISKQIEIGGISLPELALGWPDLTRINLSPNPS